MHLLRIALMQHVGERTDYGNNCTSSAPVASDRKVLPASYSPPFPPLSSCRCDLDLRVHVTLHSTPHPYMMHTPEALKHAHQTHACIPEACTLYSCMYVYYPHGTLEYAVPLQHQSLTHPCPCLRSQQAWRVLGASRGYGLSTRCHAEEPMRADRFGPATLD